MFRPRIIPVLLLKGRGLVKSARFRSHKYIGEPINAVRIFNDLKADELVFLDIQASSENRLVSLEFVKNVGEEASMPFSVGGGIRSLDDIESVRPRRWTRTLSGLHLRPLARRQLSSAWMSKNNCSAGRGYIFRTASGRPISIRSPLLR